MVDRRVEVVARLKSLEEAAPLVTFLQNPNANQELRADKQYNLQMLNERYQSQGVINGESSQYRSGTIWKCNRNTRGSGSEGADSSLEKQYNKDLTLKESETIALSILK
ncbi:eukaryotic translation initiation factor 3 subunit E [Artemisia annua]|uniref:Eukaryotic translation initiation factor 3 subunit E n=1 Tax=Artemisia annua TaxID=35608 RepID=A0A2U1NBI8_ARTAN|nr:eukaryotic translation initiation factor 3 subunit E [Artemisia annua]